MSWEVWGLSAVQQQTTIFCVTSSRILEAFFHVVCFSSTAAKRLALKGGMMLTFTVRFQRAQFNACLMWNCGLFG